MVGQKTSTAGVLAYHSRKIAQGLKEYRRLYGHPEDEAAVRKFSAQLTKRRARKVLASAIEEEKT